MSGLKLPLMLLLLVVVLFVVFMAMGSKNSQSGIIAGNNSTAPAPDTTTQAANFNVDDYPVIKSLGSALGAFSPKLDVKQIQPSLTTFNLQTKSSYTLTVTTDSKNKFRNAKFSMPTSQTQRCARLVYNSAEDPPTGLGDLKNQDSEQKGSADAANPKPEAALTVLSSGGTITIERNSGFQGPCIVVLEQ
jgi:hypothetical protein